MCISCYINSLLTHVPLKLTSAQGPEIKKKSGSDLKILGARRMTWRKFHSTEDPLILGSTVHSVAQDLYIPSYAFSATQEGNLASRC